jgi:outer membrane protein W
MKRIALILIAIFVIAAVSFAGDMAKSGSWGIQTSLGAATGVSGAGLSTSTVGFKFWASDNMAVRIEAGFTSATPGGGSSSSAYDVGAGFEYHMAPLAGSVSPYVGLGLGYSGVSISGASDNPSQFSVLGYWGGEYFFSSNFSWAGQIGIGYVSMTPGGGGSTSSAFGTTSATTIFSWYLN